MSADTNAMSGIAVDFVWITSSAMSPLRRRTQISVPDAAAARKAMVRLTLGEAAALVEVRARFTEDHGEHAGVALQRAADLLRAGETDVPRAVLELEGFLEAQ